jgi:hypothetical protein
MAHAYDEWRVPAHFGKAAYCDANTCVYGRLYTDNGM